MTASTVTGPMAFATYARPPIEPEDQWRGSESRAEKPASPGQARLTALARADADGRDDEPGESEQARNASEHPAHAPPRLGHGANGNRRTLGGCGPTSYAAAPALAAALTLQAALLVRHSPGPVADAFVASRLGGDHGGTFGTLGASVGPDAVSLLLERALRA